MTASTSPASGERSTARTASIGTGLGLTILAWLVSRTVVGIASPRVRNPFSFVPNNWVHWDSFSYLYIAAHGSTLRAYDARPRLCGTWGYPGWPYENIYHYHWCGLAVWLSGYPWIARGVNLLGIPLPDAALAVSWVAVASFLFIAWWGWCRSLAPARALLVLVLLGIFPGAVFNFAIFPTSVALAALAGGILAASRGRFLIAALSMSLATLSYPSAWFAVLGLTIGMVVAVADQGPRLMVRRALWGLAGLGGIVITMVSDRLSLGHFDAYFLIQLQPGIESVGHPGQNFYQLLVERSTSTQLILGHRGGLLLAAQGLLVVALVGSICAVVCWRWLKGRRETMDLYPALTSAAVIVGLLLASNSGSWDRSLVLAAPSILCLRKAPIWALVALAVASTVLTAGLSHFFFLNRLP